MSHRFRLRFSNLAIVLLLLGVAACGTDAEQDADVADDSTTDIETADDSTADTEEAGEAADGEPLLVGFNSPLSEPPSFAAISNALLGGLETYVDRLNDNGGIDGRPIQITALDDAADPQRSITNFQELVDDGALVVAGNASSAAWGSIGPLAEEEQVPQIGLTGIATFFIPEVDPWLFSSFGMTPTIAQLQPITATDFVDGDIETYALFRAASPATEDWSQSIQAFIDETDGYGWDLLREEAVALEASNVDAQARALAQTNPDIIFGSTLDDQAVLFAEALRVNGYEGPIFTCCAVEATMERVADEGFYALRFAEVGTNSDLPAAEEMLEAAAEYNRSDLTDDPTFTIGYVLGMVIEAALRSCSPDCDPAAVRDGLDDLNLDTGGLTGPVVTSPDNHYLISSGRVITWSEDEGGTTFITDWTMDPRVAEATGAGGG